MSKITTLRIGKGRQKRVNMFLDGKFACSLEAEIVVKEGLKNGQELSASQIEALTKLNHFHRCRNTAIRYLGYRPRSESEIKTRLLQRGYDGNTIEEVITSLKEQGLVDDIVFARFWAENRESFNPRSRQLIKLELKQKKVPDEITDQVISDVNDDDNAYRAALSRVRYLPQDDYPSFQRRLGAYLKRRGFIYEVINHTIKRLWSERRN